MAVRGDASWHQPPHSGVFHLFATAYTPTGLASEIVLMARWRARTNAIMSEVPPMSEVHPSIAPLRTFELCRRMLTVEAFCTAWPDDPATW